MAHCTLPAGGVSKPVQHRIVEAFWFCLGGDGEVWRKPDEREVTPFSPGVSLTIPSGTCFQLNDGNTPPDREGPHIRRIENCA
jgi:mannose-6-phosphate isomerase-like protein (cupin superfamily)